MFNLPPPTPEIVAVVIALFMLLGLFGWGLHQMFFGQRARLARRIASVSGKADRSKPERSLLGVRRHRSIQARLKQVDASRAHTARSALREQLAMAGLKIDVPRFLVICAVLTTLIAAVTISVGLPPIAIILAPLVLGLGLPKMVVAFLARRRMSKFTAVFADALDIVVRGVRTGLPLGECIAVIGREMPEPLGAEFRLIAESQKMGLPLQDSLARAVERMPTTEFRFFAIVLTIQRQTGGNLAETLSKLSDVIRGRKRMRDRVQAYSAEAKSSAAIIGSLPVAVTVLLSVVAPSYIGRLFTTQTGHTLLGFGVLTMAVGILVMRKMINLDI